MELTEPDPGDSALESRSPPAVNDGAGPPTNGALCEAMAKPGRRTSLVAYLSRQWVDETVGRYRNTS